MTPRPCQRFLVGCRPDFSTRPREWHAALIGEKSMKKSPLQQVQDEFGSKQALAEKLIPRLERKEDETDEEFERRIETASNRQLLRLWRVEEQIDEEFGSRDALIDSIVELRFGKANADYRAKLETYNNARLLDIHQSATH